MSGGEVVDEVGGVGIDSELFEVFYPETGEGTGAYSPQATVFDGRMIWREDEFEDDDEDDGDEFEDDGIRTVEDLLNMGEEERERLVEALDEVGI